MVSLMEPHGEYTDYTDYTDHTDRTDHIGCANRCSRRGSHPGSA